MCSLADAIEDAGILVCEYDDYGEVEEGFRVVGEDKREDQVAEFYFEWKQWVVDLGDGFQFLVPPMSEQVRKSSAEEKDKWVCERVNEVLEMYITRKANRGVGVGNPADENLRGITVNHDPQLQILPWRYSTHNVAYSILVRLITDERILWQPALVLDDCIEYVHKGGKKTYSRGSLDFRAVYVSLLLFQGSYVWIKFRDRENDYSKGCLYKKHLTKTSGEKYVKWEPRYRPPGTPARTKTRLKLGEYKREDHATVVLQVAKFYYEEKQGVVDLGDGFQFPVPPMSEQVRKSSAEEKEKWVRETAKEVLEKYKTRKANRGVGVGNPADENLRGITVNHDPELQSELEAGQQYNPIQIRQSLEWQNLNLKLLIAKDVLADAVRSNGEDPIQNLQRENLRLKNIWEQVKTSGGVALEPPLRSDMESMNQQPILQIEPANQDQRLPTTQQPLEYPHSGESLENEGLEGTLEPCLEESGWYFRYFDEVASTIPENSSIQT